MITYLSPELRPDLAAMRYAPPLTLATEDPVRPRRGDLVTVYVGGVAVRVDRVDLTRLALEGGSL
jgi:hypothetical protein